MYAPNGNPRPGPKFDYKLAWLDSLRAHAQELLDSAMPVLLMGDFNMIPTDEDVYKPERWAKDALFAPEAREKYRALVSQGWTDTIRHLFPTSGSTPSGNIGGIRSSATRESGSIMPC